MLTTLITYVWYFFAYSFLGWATEVIFATCVRGGFENRGFLNGPVCPIYGFGIVAVVLCLNGVRDNFLLLFAGSVVVTSVLELITGLLMEKLFHHRWWDYSRMPLNIGGYICLGFSLIWGLACVLLIDVIHPIIAGLISHIPSPVSYILLPVFLLTFLVDIAATSSSVFHLNKNLEEIEKLAAQIHRMSDSIGNVISKSADKVYTSEGVQKMKENAEKNLEKNREKYAELKTKLEELTHGVGFIQKRLIKTFPSMRSTKYAEALERIREDIKTRKMNGK